MTSGAVAANIANPCAMTVSSPCASGAAAIQSRVTLSRLLKEARMDYHTPDMAEIVGAAMTAHAPLITGKPDVSRPEQRDRLYAGFREAGRRLQAARPDLLVVFVNDHLQNFAYDNLPA